MTVIRTSLSTFVRTSSANLVCPVNTRRNVYVSAGVLCARLQNNPKKLTISNFTWTNSFLQFHSDTTRHSSGTK